MKFFIKFFVLVIFIAILFVGWRYYTHFDWCKNEIKTETEYSKNNNYKSNGEVEKLNEALGSLFGVVGTNAYTSNQKELLRNYYTYPNGDNFVSYEEALSSCKSEWSNSLF